MFSINNARLLICTYLFRENCKYFETLSFQLCWIANHKWLKDFVGCTFCIFRALKRLNDT